MVTTTTYEEFLAVMRTDPRTTNIDESSMSSIYAYVIAKVKKREEEERRDVEHNERHAMDDLRSVLKHLDPPVSVTDTWEAIRPRVEKFDEYRALKSDTLRQSVFDKYIRRLKDKESDRRERSRRDPRDRERGDRDRRERDREYRNGHSDSHRRHRTRTRSPEQDPYAAERRLAQQDREARYRNNESTGLSPPYRRDRERERDDHHRYERSRQGSGDHYIRERREREVERERSYVSRADPRERSVSELDYGGEPRPLPARRRRESDESASTRRDNKVSYKSLRTRSRLFANTLSSELSFLHPVIVGQRRLLRNYQRKTPASDLAAKKAKSKKTRWYLLECLGNRIRSCEVCVQCLLAGMNLSHPFEMQSDLSFSFFYGHW